VKPSAGKKKTEKNSIVELVTLNNKGWKKVERRGLWKLLSLTLTPLTWRIW